MSERRTVRYPATPHTVARLGTDADGVVEGGSELVFVRGALPGDVVALGKLRRDGKIQRADLMEVLTPSPDRVPSACNIAERCGGCPLMAASDQLSSTFKRHAIGQALASAAAADLPFALTCPQPLLGYRTRARLTFDRNRLGYRGVGTRTVLDAPECSVLSPVLARALTWIRRELLPKLAGEGELHLASLAESADAGALLAITTQAPQREQLYRTLETAVAEGAFRGTSLTVAGAGPAIAGQSFETSRDIDGRSLQAPLGAFRQAHAMADELLGHAVVRMAQPEGLRVLELHAGHGNFTLALASRAASLDAVELAPAAAAALRINLETHQLRATVHTREAAAYLRARKRKDPLDLVVLDPPRTGAKELIPLLIERKVPRVVYVSCSPITLGRDLGMLAAGGYRVVEAEAFDLFPKTAHVEAVVHLEVH